MKWWPADFEAGDILRIKCGDVWHYCIYVGEDKVVQFGEPPTRLLLRNEAEIKVIESNIEDFAQGNIPEVAILDHKELKKRFPKEETVRIAKSRIGEGGYSLLHNNCEHFVNECVFGIKKSSQIDEVREFWKNKLGNSPRKTT